jgi:hypothetical protein
MSTEEFRASTPLRVLRRFLTGALVGLAILAGVQASRVYDEAGRWFSRATYLTECFPTVATLAQTCAALAAEQMPHAPHGLVPSDKDLLLVEGETLHNTGTALLTLSGLFLAAAALVGTVGNREPARLARVRAHSGMSMGRRGEHSSRVSSAVQAAPAHLACPGDGRPDG